MSSPPIWIGMIRSIVNCSSGRSSIATSVLVLVPRVLARLLAGSVLGLTITIGPPIAHRCADAGDCAIDVQHAGGNSEEKQHDNPPWPRAEPVIDRPSESGRDTDRDHQFDADAQPEPEALLHGRAVSDRRRPPDALSTCPVDPFAKTCQRIRRLALAHLGKRNHAIPVPAESQLKRGAT